MESGVGYNKNGPSQNVAFLSFFLDLEPIWWCPPVCIFVTLVSLLHKFRRVYSLWSKVFPLNIAILLKCKMTPIWKKKKKLAHVNIFSTLIYCEDETYVLTSSGSSRSQFSIRIIRSHTKVNLFWYLPQISQALKNHNYHKSEISLRLP